MTDLTPEQRAVDILLPFTHVESGITWVTNPSYEKLRVAIAAEIRAAEQAAREKALRSAAKLMCDDCDDDEVAYQKADKSYWHSDVSQGGEEIEWRCGASDILRLLEEKND